MIVKIYSFGFKHGLPAESDFLLDVRFLPNPYYIPHLKETTGLEPATAAHVLDNDIATSFFNHLSPLIIFLTQQYLASKRNSIAICVGCTGGQHRSVAVSEKLAKTLANSDIEITVTHRDIKKK